MIDEKARIQEYMDAAAALIRAAGEVCDLYGENGNEPIDRMWLALSKFMDMYMTTPLAYDRSYGRGTVTPEV